MKKIIILLLAIGLLTGLGIYTSKLLSEKGSSDEYLAAFNFEIKDTASINKVIITEASGREISLIRQGKSWVKENGDCIQQEMMFNVLDAAYNIRFKGYVPENSMKMVINRITTLGKKVQFFVNGSWSKTWYIGDATPDHHGSFMLVESAEGGKSDLPVIAEIKNLNGIIDPRFVADPLQWQCSQIMAYQMNEISAVTVNYSERAERNFEVRSINNKYYVKFNGKQLTTLDTNMVVRYLQNFKKIHFESGNYELDNRQIDSLKKSTPFCKLTINTFKGEKKLFKLYRAAADNSDLNTDDYGEKVPYDVNRFWCVLPNGDVVKCQYFVFNPLIMGNVYFDPERYERLNQNR